MTKTLRQLAEEMKMHAWLMRFRAAHAENDHNKMSPSACNDIAGYVDAMLDRIIAEDQQAALTAIKTKLEDIVCTKGIDAGVVMLSQEGSTHYDPELKIRVYDHEFFSPLGDALMELHKIASEAMGESE